MQGPTHTAPREGAPSLKQRITRVELALYICAKQGVVLKETLMKLRAVSPVGCVHVSRATALQAGHAYAILPVMLGPEQ